MELLFHNIVLRPGEEEKSLPERIGSMYGIAPPARCRIIHRSLDARDKKRIVYRYRVAAEVPDAAAALLLTGREGVTVCPEVKKTAAAVRCGGRRRVIVIGAGPSGLFCALRLIEAGVRVELIERGSPVERRMDDIRRMKSSGLLNPESNVLFGEGGAGAYSDGKLVTRTHRPEISWVFDTLVAMGAPEYIRYEQKPHLGTDGLVPVILSVRKAVLESGSIIRFNTCVKDFIIREGEIIGAVDASGEQYRGDAVVLATGHSARDVYELLMHRMIRVEKKPFALGVRVEHPSSMINEIQYGAMSRGGILPAADYRLAFNNRQTGRSVYSFCMCPGGEVINSSSEAGMLCTNGMSYSGRDGLYSNAAMVVTVTPDDGAEGPLGGVMLQRNIEERAYGAGGGGFFAPCQRITSFITGKHDMNLPHVTYLPGVKAAPVRSYLPSWIAEEIACALKSFDRKMKGFISDEGVLIGAETRSSSPVRIPRGDDCQSVSHPGLYPVGEGAGYAGGIISSAVDGMRAADMICNRFRDNR